MKPEIKLEPIKEITEKSDGTIIDALQHFLYRPNSSQLRQQISEMVLQKLRCYNIPVNFDNVDFSVEGVNGSITLVSHNLYTAILLYGFEVNYYKVKNQTEYDTGVGTIRFENGKAYFEPVYSIKGVNHGI